MVAVHVRPLRPLLDLFQPLLLIWTVRHPTRHGRALLVQHRNQRIDLDDELPPLLRVWQVSFQKLKPRDASSQVPRCIPRCKRAAQRGNHILTRRQNEKTDTTAHAGIDG